MKNVALSISDVQALTGIGRTTIYQLINSNQLPAKKLHSKTIILRADLDKFLQNLDDYKINKENYNA